MSDDDSDDYYYIKVFVSPVLIFLFCMILLKFCWKCCDCWADEIDEEDHPITPIYVIPISMNESDEYDSDDDSVVSVDSYAPPSYDSLEPPPPYPQKQNIPDEAPPAYSQLEMPAGEAEHFGFHLPSEQSFHPEE